MRRTVPLFAVAVLTVLAVSPEAGAITYGEPDGDRHPNVGALLGSFEVEEGQFELFQICTGSLMAPDLFLTATHCLIWGATPDMLFVSFDTNLNLQDDYSVQPAQKVAVTQFWTHPDFRPSGMSTAYNDVAVVQLAAGATKAAYPGIVEVQLPTLNFLREQAAHGGLRGHDFVAVGYGDQKPTMSSVSPFYSAPYDGLRRTVPSRFMALSPYHLFLLANNVATGGGGSGGGDSGGPRFYAEGSNLVVAICTSGDPMGQALNQNQRLDTPSVRSFLDDFVTLP